MTRSQQKRETKRRAAIKVKEQRAARLAQGCCPIHGIFMCQIGLSKNERVYIVACPRCQNAGIPTIARCRDQGEPCTLLYKKAWNAAIKALTEQREARNNSRETTAAASSAAECH